jgi:hypothetical protein
MKSSDMSCEMLLQSVADFILKQAQPTCSEMGMGGIILLD